MALAEIAFGEPNDQARFGSAAVWTSQPSSVTQLDTAGTTETTAAATEYDAARVTALDAAIKVSFGPAADASTDTTAQVVLAGTTVYFGKINAGDIASIAAA